MSASAQLTPWLTHEDVWVEAERLVVQEGWEYTRVAEHLRIPLSTLQKRAAKGTWRKLREQHVSYQAQVRRFKAQLLQDITKAWDAAKDLEGKLKVTQLLHAWRGLEQAFPEHRYPTPEAPAEEEGGLETETDEQLLARIRGAAR